MTPQTVEDVEKRRIETATNPVKYRQAFVQDGDWYHCDSCGKSNLTTSQTTVDIFEGLCQGILCHSCKILVRRYERTPEDLHSTSQKIKEEADRAKEKANVVITEKVPEMIEHSRRLDVVASYLAWLRDPHKGRNQYHHVQA